MATREDTYAWAQCAASVNSGKPVILEVMIPESASDKLTYDAYGWKFEGSIPPEWISVLPDRPNSPLSYDLFPMMIAPWLRNI
jgi:hypothetical protein